MLGILIRRGVHATYGRRGGPAKPPPHWLHCCAQAAHRHHKVVLHLGMALLTLDLLAHLMPLVHHVMDGLDIPEGSCGSTGAVLATSVEYLRGVEPPL